MSLAASRTTSARSAFSPLMRRPHLLTRLVRTPLSISGAPEVEWRSRYREVESGLIDRQHLVAGGHQGTDEQAAIGLRGDHHLGRILGKGR